MSTYLIGDVHGCYDELQALLQQVSFDPSRDRLWLTGDSGSTRTGFTGSVALCQVSWLCCPCCTG